MTALLKVTAVQSVSNVNHNFQQNHNGEFQNILENNTRKLEVDNEQVYDASTYEIVEDLDNLSNDTLKDLLREE